MHIIHEDQATHVAVTRVDGEHRLVSTASIAAGATIFRLIGERTGRASRHSVQVDWDEHIETPCAHSNGEALHLYLWRFLNHSCDPSAMICGTEVVARRSIEPLEEITFDYDTTEYDMAEPFDCRCGAQCCRGRIRGFRHLDPKHRERLRPRLAPYLVRLLDGGDTPVPAGSEIEVEGSVRG